MTSYWVSDAMISKATDLKGKKVGVGAIGSSQDRLNIAYVEQAGLAPSDITRIKKVIIYEIKIPLKIDGELAQDKVLNLKLIQEVKTELESKKVSR